MAIISIPSSIAGVSIPGAAVNLLKGPLASLFGLKTGLAIHQYPRDLGSATRGHYILFYINRVSEAQYNAASKAFESFGKGETTLQSTALALQEASKVESGDLSSNRTKSTEAVIALYMPETMAFTYNSVYDETSLLGIGKEVTGAFSGLKNKKGGIGNIVGSIAGGFNKGLTIAGSQTARLALQTQGLAINPQKQLLFQGIGFREYQLVFTFTPYSKKESEDIANIIKTFKEAAAPTITKSVAGMFFKVPASFNLEFMFNGRENEKVSKVAESVLTSVDVNYSPNTWAAMDDGAPSQIMLTLNFKEIELIDSKKIGNKRSAGPDGGGY